MKPTEADLETAGEFVSGYGPSINATTWEADAAAVAQLIANERERIGGWLALLGLDIDKVIEGKEEMS